ncbi:MAG: hypothetical protein ACE5GE_17280 [Phycisphaerae bacterium]
MKKRAKKKQSTRRRSRAEVMTVLAEALREEFPNDTVDVSDGYRENIHVMVVSRRFDDMVEQEKHAWLWSIIDRTDLTATQKRLISLVLPLSPSEIK